MVENPHGVGAHLCRCDAFYAPIKACGHGAGVSGATLYNYFRSYDSRTGRYTQSDPIGMDGGWNRFGYVDGNPVSQTDAHGLCPFCIPLFTGGVGAVAGGYAAYSSGGSVAVGAGVGFLGGAVASLPASWLGTVGLGILGGMISGSAGDASNGNLPTAQNLAFGGALGLMGAPFGPVGRSVLGSEIAGVSIGATGLGITDLLNSSASARRDVLKPYQRQAQQCPAR
jgi:RHS repeat-associated protein